MDCDGDCKPEKEDPFFELKIVKSPSGLPVNNSRLFDLNEDEEEINDLSEDYPEIVADLQLKLK